MYILHCPMYSVHTVEKLELIQIKPSCNQKE